MARKSLQTAVLYAENATISAGSSNKRIISRKYTTGGQIIWVQELLTFGRKTRNGNNFSREAFAEAIESPYVAERLRGKRFYGELDHPSKEDFERFTSVHLTNASHRINKLWFEGETLYGEFETMKSPNGDIVRGMVEQDAEIACSFRGYGVPKPDGTEQIIIVAWDIVFHPSDPTALSKEGTFQDKLYAEGYSTAQVVNAMMCEGYASYIPMNKSSHVYAEAAAMDITPEAIVKVGNEAVGFTFKSKEMTRVEEKSRAMKSFIRNF